jgi:hypothetical protein
MEGGMAPASTPTGSVAAFNQSNCCSEYLQLQAPQASRTTFTLLASIIGHKHTKQTNKQLRTMHHSKEKL